MIICWVMGDIHTGRPNKTHFQNWVPLASPGKFPATKWITVLIWWPGIDQQMLTEVNSESAFLGHPVYHYLITLNSFPNPFPFLQKRPALRVQPLHQTQYAIGNQPYI